MIYAVQAKDGGLVKIGWTTGDPQRRLRALQAGSPVELVLWHTEDGDRDTERDFHDRFSHLRVRLEWFYPADELAEWAGCVPAADPDVAAVILSARQTGFNEGYDAGEAAQLERMHRAAEDILGAVSRVARTEFGVNVRNLDNDQVHPLWDDEKSLRHLVRSTLLSLLDRGIVPDGWDIEVRQVLRAA